MLSIETAYELHDIICGCGDPDMEECDLFERIWEKDE